MFLGKLLLACLIFFGATATRSYAMDTAPGLASANTFDTIPKLTLGHGIVHGAASYNIHGYQCKTIPEEESFSDNESYLPNKVCICSGRWGNVSMERNPIFCPYKDFVNHETEALIVTYHNKFWHIIAWEDITDLQLDAPITAITFDEYKKLRAFQRQNLINYCQSHLDPKFKKIPAKQFQTKYEEYEPPK